MVLLQNLGGIVVICTLHLIFSAVLGAGGLLHSNKFAGDLGEYPENSKPQKFDFNGMTQIN